MTKEEIAKQLDGGEYPFSVHPELEKQAAAAGLVIVFGASDDLMEFRGAIHDEIGCHNSGTASIYNGKLLEECDCHCAHFWRASAQAVNIHALWDQGEYSWIYETKIPHATFEVLEDGEKYCRGIVFELKDAASPAA
jgi:hypothetical protein